MSYLDALKKQVSGSQQRRSRNSSNLSQLLASAAATRQPIGAGPTPGVKRDLPVGARPVAGTQDTKGLHPSLSAAVTRMMKDAPGSIKINSGYRSPEKQAQLYAAAVKKYGSEKAARKWVAPPGKSDHGRGLAMDLGFSDAKTKAWVHANAAKYGLKFPMSYEPWHVTLGN